MKYVRYKFCKGSFLLVEKIDLSYFLNEDEQERFSILHKEDETKLSNEDYDWYHDVLNRIEEESNFLNNSDVSLDSYEVDDWEEYPEENEII